MAARHGRNAPLDALRVIVLIRAIESRGAGYTLGQWLEMLLGWDTERTFLAIQACTDKGWIEPSDAPKMPRATSVGRGHAAYTRTFEDLAGRKGEG